MEDIEKIGSLVQKVLQNKLSLEQAIELLSSDQFKPFLNEDVVRQLVVVADELRLHSPQAAYALSTLSYEASKIKGLTPWQAYCEGTIGMVLLDLGRFRESIPFFEQALGFFKKEDEKQDIAATIGNLGIAYDSLGDHQKAIEYHQQALQISQKIEDRKGEGNALGNVGNVYRSLADYPRAIEYFKQALKISREIGDRRGAGASIGNLGLVYSSQGDYPKAIEYHQQALQISREIGDRIGEGNSLGSLGVAYDSLGDHQKAIEYYQQALQISREIGNRHIEGYLLNNLGIAYECLGDHQKAIEYYQQALQISREIGDRIGEGSRLGNLGITYALLEDYPKAIEYYQQALEISREMRDRKGEIHRLGNLGNAYSYLRNYSKAIEYYQQALKKSREIGSIDTERIWLADLGNVHERGLKQNDAAYDYYKQSIELVEKMRRGMKQEEHRSSFFGESEDVYDLMILLCNQIRREQKEKLVESFEYLERSKSRTFLEILAQTPLKPSKEIPAQLVDRENDLLQEIRVLYLSNEKQKVSLAEIQKLESELDVVWTRIEKIDPEYIFMRRGKPLSFTQIQQLVKFQGDKFCLVEYFLGFDKLLVFILRSDDSELKVESVDLSSSRFNYYLKQYVDEFMNIRKDLGQTWHNLSKYLIDPIFKYLDGIDTIYFVPHRQIHYLPLHALRHNGRYLIEKFKIAYSPSASVISYCQKKRRDKMEECVSFGMVFEEEADLVGKIFKGSSLVYKGPKVTKSLVEKESKEKDIIHFSCHGFFHPQMPLKSGLLLANEEVLTIEDVFQLRLDADLVTLSACETGINEQKPGDDLVGLTRSFMYAGTPSVVVSLWSVSARSTIELMEKFYSYLKEGKSKVEALQKAQLEISKIHEYTHPYYWAPFILVGDWK